MLCTGNKDFRKAAWLQLRNESSVRKQWRNVLASLVQFKSKTFTDTEVQVQRGRSRKDKLELCSPGIPPGFHFASLVLVPHTTVLSALSWQSPLISVAIVFVILSFSICFVAVTVSLSELRSSNTVSSFPKWGEDYNSDSGLVAVKL